MKRKADNNTGRRSNFFFLAGKLCQVQQNKGGCKYRTSSEILKFRLRVNRWSHRVEIRLRKTGKTSFLQKFARGFFFRQCYLLRQLALSVKTFWLNTHVAYTSCFSDIVCSSNQTQPLISHCTLLRRDSIRHLLPSENKGIYLYAEGSLAVISTFEFARLMILIALQLEITGGKKCPLPHSILFLFCFVLQVGNRCPGIWCDGSDATRILTRYANVQSEAGATWEDVFDQYWHNPYIMNWFESIRAEV